MTMTRRRLWCYQCRRRALFPTLHFILHTIDLLKASNPDRKDRDD